MAHGRLPSSPANNLTVLAHDREAANPPESPGSDSSSQDSRFLFQLHGFLLAIVFTLIMPVGVGIIRQKGGESTFSRHWVVQLVAVLVALVAMGIAIVQSKKLIQVRSSHASPNFLPPFFQYAFASALNLTIPSSKLSSETRTARTSYSV